MPLDAGAQEKVTHQLQVRDEAQARQRKRLRETTAANQADSKLQKQAEGAISALLAPAHGVAQVELGIWECKNSPTGTCYYDAEYDTYWDECLVCGDPHERK